MVNLYDGLPIVSWPVHPQRTRKRRPDEPPPHALVYHTSEQAFATVTSAENLARAIGSPPVTTNGRTNQASYQWGVDLDSIAAMVPPDDIAYHAPPNWHGEAICLTGRAARDWTGTSDGVDDWPELRLGARLGAVRCILRGFPIRKLTVDQVRREERGICDHFDISRAFGKTDHTDVGAGFPWPAFIEMIDAEAARLNQQHQETTMDTAMMIRFEGTKNVFLIGAGPALHLTEKIAQKYAARGVETVVADKHEQGLESVLAQAGLEEDDLVPADA